MNYLIAYDICNAKRLVKVAKCLRRYGLRQEKSVFVCNLEKRQLTSLCNELHNLSTSEDTILAFPVPDASECISIRGKLFLYEKKDVYY